MIEERNFMLLTGFYIPDIHDNHHHTHWCWEEQKDNLTIHPGVEPGTS